MKKKWKQFIREEIQITKISNTHTHTKCEIPSLKKPEMVLRLNIKHKVSYKGVDEVLKERT